MTKAWYKISLATLLTGGISLQVMPSIRYWYWDYYYDMIAKQNKKAIEQEQEEQGWNNDRTTQGGIDFRQ